MEEHDWVRVLYALYEGQLVVTERMGEGEGIEYELIEYLNNHNSLNGMTEEEIVTAVDNLKKVGLVRAGKVYGEAFRGIEEEERMGGLTPEGFNVAHERKLAEREQEINDNLSFFTLILALAAIIQGIAASLQLSDPFSVAGLLLALVVLAIGIVVYQSELPEQMAYIVRSFKSK